MDLVWVLRVYLIWNGEIYTDKQTNSHNQVWTRYKWIAFWPAYAPHTNTLLSMMHLLWSTNWRGSCNPRYAWQNLLVFLDCLFVRHNSLAIASGSSLLQNLTENTAEHGHWIFDIHFSSSFSLKTLFYLEMSALIGLVYISNFFLKNKFRNFFN